MSQTHFAPKTTEPVPATPVPATADMDTAPTVPAPDRRLADPATLHRATNGHLARAGRALRQLQRHHGNAYIQRVIAATPPQPSPDWGESPLLVNETTVPPPTWGRLGGGKEPNRTGLPDALKAGVEALSGLNLDAVRVHYNSPQPARLNALAYTQGTEIHVAPGQERHLAHEAWHVVQQMEGRVKATLQDNGIAINDDLILEHEADVMGRKALQAKLPEQAVAADFQNLLTSSLRQVVLENGVIQCNGYEIEETTNSNNIAEQQSSGYEIKEATNSNNIAEQEIGIGQEIQFSNFTSCIGIIGKKNDGNLVGVHLVRVGENDVPFGKDDIEPLKQILTGVSDIVIVGMTDCWQDENVLTELSATLEGTLYHKDYSNQASVTLRAKIGGDGKIIVEDVDDQGNLSKPTQLQALTYTRKADKFTEPARERYLAYEAQHLVQAGEKSVFQFVDSRAEGIAQRKLQKLTNDNLRCQPLSLIEAGVNKVRQFHKLDNAVIQLKWDKVEKSKVWKWDKIQDGVQWYMDDSGKLWFETDAKESVADVSQAGETNKKSWDDWRRLFLAETHPSYTSESDMQKWATVLPIGEGRSSIVNFSQEAFAEGSTATIHKGKLLTAVPEVIDVVVKIPRPRNADALKQEAEKYKDMSNFTKDISPHIVNLLGVAEVDEGDNILVFPKMEGDITKYWDEIFAMMIQRSQKNESYEDLVNAHAGNLLKLQQLFNNVMGILEKEGYVHTDLQPENILWSGNVQKPDFKIADFGRLTKKEQLEKTNQSVDYKFSAQSMLTAIFGTLFNMESTFTTNALRPNKENQEKLKAEIKLWHKSLFYEYQDNKTLPTLIDTILSQIGIDKLIETIAANLLKKEEA